MRCSTRLEKIIARYGYFFPYPWDGPWGIERKSVNDRQFSRFLIILVGGFFLLHIPLAFYYVEFLSKWSYEIWMAFLGVILISGVFQVPDESDYNRAVQSSFLHSLILLGAKDFSEYRSKSRALSKTFFYTGLILFGILFVHVILKSKAIL